MYPHLIDSGEGTFNYNLTLNWKSKSRGACMAAPGSFNYTVDVTIDQGLAWLQDKYGGGYTVPTEAPFFLYLSFTIPHAGGWDSWPKAAEEGAPVPSDGMYADKDWPDVEKDHAAAVTYLDSQV